MNTKAVIGWMWFAGVVFNVCLIVAIIWVAVHFLGKYW